MIVQRDLPQGCSHMMSWSTQKMKVIGQRSRSVKKQTCHQTVSVDFAGAHNIFISGQRSLGQGERSHGLRSKVIELKVTWILWRLHKTRIYYYAVYYHHLLVYVQSSQVEYTRECLHCTLSLGYFYPAQGDDVEIVFMCYMYMDCVINDGMHYKAEVHGWAEELPCCMDIASSPNPFT